MYILVALPWMRRSPGESCHFCCGPLHSGNLLVFCERLARSHLRWKLGELKRETICSPEVSTRLIFIITPPLITEVGVYGSAEKPASQPSKFKVLESSTMLSSEKHLRYGNIFHPVLQKLRKLAGIPEFLPTFAFPKSLLEKYQYISVFPRPCHKFILSSHNLNSVATHTLVFLWSTFSKS